MTPLCLFTFFLRVKQTRKPINLVTFCRTKSLMCMIFCLFVTRFSGLFDLQSVGYLFKAMKKKNSFSYSTWINSKSKRKKSNCWLTFCHRLDGKSSSTYQLLSTTLMFWSSEVFLSSKRLKSSWTMKWNYSIDLCSDRRQQNSFTIRLMTCFPIN